MIVRQLIEDDISSIRKIRLEALQNDPIVFVSFYEYEVNKPDEFYKQMLTTHLMIGAFEDDEIVGISTIIKNNTRKQRHKGIASFTYTSPAKRGNGIAKQLKEFSFEIAKKSDITQLTSGVISTNIGMIELNKSLGFEITYTERNAMKHDDIFYDLTYMIKYF